MEREGRSRPSRTTIDDRSSICEHASPIGNGRVKKTFALIRAVGCLLFLIGILRAQNDRSRTANRTNHALGVGRSTSMGNTSNNLPSDHVNITPAPSRRVSFVPFPHRRLGSGAHVRCKWQTMDVRNDAAMYDATQLAAFAEGVCIPPKLRGSLHVFSSAEAVECLSPQIQQRDIKLIVSGDSYTKQLFVGLADILMSKQLYGNKEIIGSAERDRVVKRRAQQWITKRHERDPSFPIVRYECEKECYGTQAPFHKKCSDCINSFTGKNADAVGIVGAGIHIKHQYANASDAGVNSTVEEIDKFLSAAERTILVSVPSYHHTRTPGAYRPGNVQMHEVYRGVLPSVAPRSPGRPFLDVFQLTDACHMRNCSYDGGHRSRYVNRWKAQMLLNTLCRVRDSAPSGEDSDGAA